MVIDPPTALSWRVREHINYGLTRFWYVSLRPLLPRSRHLSVALIDGGSTQNLNNTGVRLWTDCQQVTSLTSFCKQVPTTRCRRQVSAGGFQPRATVGGSLLFTDHLFERISTPK